LTVTCCVDTVPAATALPVVLLLPLLPVLVAFGGAGTAVAGFFPCEAAVGAFGGDVVFFAGLLALGDAVVWAGPAVGEMAV
jgi:hypothetical protein